MKRRLDLAEHRLRNHDILRLVELNGEGTDVELTIVTMTFDTADDATLLAILSKYVVLTRMQDGCRNVDLCSSVTHPGRHLVVQKWETPEHQRRHFDRLDTVTGIPR